MWQLAGFDVLTNPLGKRRLFDFSCGHVKHGHYTFDIIGEQIKSIQCQKQLGCDKGGALVAVNKRMVT